MSEEKTDEEVNVARQAAHDRRSKSKSRLGTTKDEDNSEDEDDSED